MLIACGINHKTAPVSLREKVAFSDHNLRDSLQHLVSHTAAREAVILTTCNRTELYCYSPQDDQLLNWLTERHQVNPGELSSHYYVYHERAALRHILRVASGLDSMILGEPQILGQIKMAYKAANDSGTVGNYLEEVFQQVFKTSKQVRGSTAIGRHSLSVAASAVNFAMNALKFTAATKVLLVGSGDTIETVAHHLSSHGIQQFYVANRTRENAQRIASQINGTALAIDELYEKIGEMDIVVSATSCPITVIDAPCVARAMQKRPHHLLVMIDLAVPRDIDPNAAEIPNVHLYNIDDLQQQVSQGLQQRQQAATQAEEIIENQIQQFEIRQNSGLVVSQIRQYRSQVETIRDQELAVALKDLERGLDPQLVLKKMAHRLTNKVLHQPSVMMRNNNYPVDASSHAYTGQLVAMDD